MYEAFVTAELEEGLQTGQLYVYHCGQIFGWHLDAKRKAEIAKELPRIRDVCSGSADEAITSAKHWIT